MLQCNYGEKSNMKNKEKGNVKIPKIFVVLMAIGPILLAAGIALIIAGVTGNFDNMAAFMAPGMVVCFCGLVCCMFGFMPLIQKAQIKATGYVVNQNKEELKDIADTRAYIANDAAHKISKSVASGVKEGLQNEKKFCKHCGAEIDTDSVYCNMCGGKQ